MKNGSMKAVGVFPDKRQVSLVEQAPPQMTSPTQVRIRTLDVGVCGTDREICSFAYGTPPAGSECLVLGHEALGEVVEVASSQCAFKPGDLVVPSVRRPCPHSQCVPCRHERQDFCSTGDFTERGIKMTHGFMTEHFVEEEKFLIQVPHQLRDVAVLVEPLTVAEKGLAQVRQIQERLPWDSEKPGADNWGEGKTAVVLGAGPVGILGTMALLASGFKTYVYSRSPAPNPKASLVESLGAPYISAQRVTVEELGRKIGPVDVIYEAVGVGRISFDVMKLMGLNAVFVFTGIPPHLPAIPVEADSLMRDLVLKNQVLVGTVNADRAAFQGAIDHLGVVQRRWPKALSSLITGHYPIEGFHELLLGKSQGIKNVIRMA